MIDLLTAAEMRAADEKTIAGGTPSRELMERAARAALEILQAKFDTTRVLFLCGNGNNGGDALAMARFFCEAGGTARVFFPCKKEGLIAPSPEDMSVDCARQYSLPNITIL